MNHDCAHCLDYTENCPGICFRAELVRDLQKRITEFVGVPITWSNFKGTEECMLRKETKMDEREFMEWFIDAVVTSDLYWDCERNEIIDEAIEKLIQAGKIKSRGTEGLFEKI